MLRTEHSDCPHAESEAQQEVLHSFGDAKGLAFSKDGKLLAVGVQDAVHIHDWPSLVHKASIRYAFHAVPDVKHLSMHAQRCEQDTSCVLAPAHSAAFVLQKREARSDRCSTRHRLQQRACQQCGTIAATFAATFAANSGLQHLTAITAYPVFPGLLPTAVHIQY